MISFEEIDNHTPVLSIDSNKKLGIYQYGEIGFPNSYILVSRLYEALEANSRAISISDCIEHLRQERITYQYSNGKIKFFKEAMCLGEAREFEIHEVDDAEGSLELGMIQIYEDYRSHKSIYEK